VPPSSNIRGPGATPPDYRALAQQLAQRYGLPFFPAQIQQESGYDPNARSPAGAEGIAQIMPATAQGWGVDPHDPVASLQAAAQHMHEYMDKYHDPSMALAAYNEGEGNLAKYGTTGLAETRDYIQKILGASPAGTSAATAPVMPTAPVQPVGLQTSQPLPLALSMPSVSQLAPPPDTNPYSGMLQNIIQGRGLLPPLEMASSFRSDQQPFMMQDSPLLTSRLQRATQPGLDASGLLAPSLTQRANTTLPLPSGYQGTNTTLPSTPGQSGTDIPVNSRLVSLSSGADRPNVPIHKQVLDFVSQVAAEYGKPLNIGTGTNHTQYVKGTDRESAHWTGWAADIPSKGAALTKLGQAALIAAGMPASKARKQPGGLFNIGGRQIIFNTDGPGIGNHYDHLHVGLSPTKETS
jgi:Transglycosylase SLT domain